MNALHRDLARLVGRVEREDAPRAAADPHRQHFHLQPPAGWLNDPNGLCVYGGAYHAFYQYAPFAADGSGVKHWGHAVSQDLLHWENRPVMLYPDAPYDLHGVYSGSALVEDGVMYLYYTGNVKHDGPYDYITAGRGHNTCLAVSRDGRTVESKQCLLYNRDYPAGLSCHVRDPKVFAYEGRYYMVQGARTLQNVGEVLVWESTDKRRWTHINTLTAPQPFGYMWECPDLFAVDGQWFLAVSPQGVPQDGLRCQNRYACGWFPLEGDFRSRCALGDFAVSDHGFDFYAPQSFEDGARRIQIGWLGMPDADYTNPTDYGWQHCLTVPCELHACGGRLFRTPVREVEALRRPAAPKALGPCFDLVLAPAAGPLALTLGGCLRLRWQEGLFTMEFTGPADAYGRTVRCAAVGPLHELRVLADASSVEVFLNGGGTVLSTRYYPAAGAAALSGMQLPAGSRVQSYALAL